MKFSRDRSVCAPQYLLPGTWTSPKASLSVRVAAIVLDEAWKYRAEWCSDVGAVWRETQEAAARGVAVAVAAGLLEELARHVLMVLGLAIQRRAEPEALVRADASMLVVI